MRTPGPAHAAGTWFARANRRLARVTAAGGENGESLLQFHRAAVRTFRSFPFRGANEDFAVALAGAAMKFVNRHGVSKHTQRVRTRRKKLPRWGPGSCPQQCFCWEAGLSVPVESGR